MCALHAIRVAFVLYQPDELHRVVTGPVAEALWSYGSRLVIYRPVTETHSGPSAAFDLVTTLWLPGTDAAPVMGLLASDEWQRAEWALSGLAAGSVVLAAETVDVR